MSDRPHIVMLMADQLRFDCLSAYGNLGVETPNLDILAEESVVFDHAYCSTPLCVPTRTSLACGKWPHTTRAIVNGGSFPTEIPFRTLGPEHRTIYEQLTDGGYEITQVGVQHISSDPPLAERVPAADFTRDVNYEEYLRQQGFEQPVNDQARVPVPEFENGRLSIKFYHDPRHVEKTEFGAEHYRDRYWARCMAEKIRAADPSEPRAWFFHCWAPHPPFFVPEPYYGMYDPANIELPENVGRWYDGMPPFLLLHTGGYRGSGLQREEWRRTWAGYFGLVTMVDDCIGRVVRALKERGIWDDALVIFTQDHGEALGSHRMFQKMTMYEESARVPLLVKPPGGAQTGRRRQMVGHVDIADTVCDYAAVDPLPDTWGESLRRPIEDPDAPWREATFCEFNGDHGRAFPSRAIITERYKYIHHFCGPDELYDLVEDPQETRSLAGSPQHETRCGDFRARIDRWMRETDDVLDMTRDADFCPCRWQRLDRDRGWR